MVGEKFDNVIRAAVSLQVSVYELHDEDISTEGAAKAMSECMVELRRAVKELLKHVEQS